MWPNAEELYAFSLKPMPVHTIGTLAKTLPRQLVVVTSVICMPGMDHYNGCSERCNDSQGELTCAGLRPGDVVRYCVACCGVLEQKPAQPAHTA
jgi:hypothetical protein